MVFAALIYFALAGLSAGWTSWWVLAPILVPAGLFVFGWLLLKGLDHAEAVDTARKGAAPDPAAIESWAAAATSRRSTEPDLAKGDDAAGAAPAVRTEARSGAASAAALLLEVARCPLVAECLERGPSGHPCSTIVLDQWKGVPDAERLARWRSAHQLPEPWDGHLATAPILFISSNPSISGSVQAAQAADLEGSPPEEFLSFTADQHPSIRRLGQGPRWTWEDDEISRYLRRTLEASGARVVVVLGRHAREVVRREAGIAGDARLHERVLIGGDARAVVFLPHPNARAACSFAACLGEPSLERLRSLLADG